MDKQKITQLVDNQDFKTAKELILQESEENKQDWLILQCFPASKANEKATAATIATSCVKLSG